MTLGRIHSLSDSDMKAAQRSGIAHLFAVSGLHTGVIGLLFLWFSRLLMLPKKGELIFVSLGMLAFIALVGFRPSGIRAAIFLIIWLMHLQHVRKIDSLSVLTTTALVMLLWSPMQFWRIDFQMSFLCMTVLFIMWPFFYDSMETWKEKMRDKFGWNWWSTIPVRASELLIISTLIQFILSPILLSTLGIFSFLAPITNLLVLFLTPILLGTAFIGATIEILLPGFGHYIVLTAGLLSSYILSVSSFISSVPLCYMETENVWRSWHVALFYGTFAASGCLVIRTNIRQTDSIRRLVIGASVPIMTLIIIYGISFKNHQTRVVFLDVDQGDAMYVQHGEISFLIDTGRSGNRILSQLEQLGVQHLQFLVITHADGDHVGGAQAVIDRYQPSQIFINDQETFEVLQEFPDAHKLNIQFVTPKTWPTFIRDKDLFETVLLQDIETDLNIQILHPHATDLQRPNRNNRSMVMLLSLGQTDVLLTGDIEVDAEQLLLDRYSNELDAIEIIKAPHHGAASSNSEIFVQSIQPQHVVMSCGIHNQYNHPADEVLLQYDSVDAEILRTDWNGRIEFTLTKDSYEIKSQRNISLPVQ